ncbi:MAG: hypothetical protein IJ371_01815 [Clostridia bacterium]|nr:hypothetical protein [Clostridia bacterium]
MKFKKQVEKLLKKYNETKNALEYDIEHFDDETANEEKGELRQVKNFLEDLEKLKKSIGD